VVSGALVLLESGDGVGSEPGHDVIGDERFCSHCGHLVLNTTEGQCGDSLQLVSVPNARWLSDDVFGERTDQSAPTHKSGDEWDEAIPVGQRPIEVKRCNGGCHRLSPSIMSQ
jgi:hypothetical protein